LRCLFHLLVSLAPGAILQFEFELYKWFLLYALLLSAFSHIHTVLFQCYEKHQYPIRGINFKTYYLRRTFSRLIRECDVDNKLGIREFWRQFNIKMAIVIRFPFYAFSLYAAIHRNATPAENESRMYTLHYFPEQFLFFVVWSF
jgi:hypothetical protein